MTISTRERIIDTALLLFNEQGTRAVTTNHIADAMGISAGNLYYHFSNKEEIIRAIYERAISDYDGFLREVAAITPDPLTTLGLFDGIFAHQERYCFLQREFPALIRQDEVLQARYREMQDRRVGFYAFLGRHWIETGSLKPMGEQELLDLVTAIWLVGDTWLSYLESMGRSDDANEVSRGSRLIYALLQPHLTTTAADAFIASGWGAPIAASEKDGVEESI
ncbi:MAG TPA: TetR/AcrR family transcriptional regulator [Coriobacteriia bacterium]|nr:TetR/AcrR family transcriptional regulator [Coriobacteriia bacterium]